MFSENASSADNQQERLQRIGYYIAGFVDGEGSFNVSLRRKIDYKIGWQVVLSFNVSQKDITMLHLLKETFSCGIIKQRKIDLLYSYDVTKPKDIVERVIPFFDKFGFLSKSKQINYKIFKDIVYMAVSAKVDKVNLVRIATLREKLNCGKGRKRKYSLSDVLEYPQRLHAEAHNSSAHDIVRPV